MWRQIGRLFIKFIGIVLPVFAALSLYCALFPMWYMDGEYAMYKQQKDYITGNGEYNRVLIMGDSRTKAGFIPDELSNDCYNLALGGIQRRTIFIGQVKPVHHIFQSVMFD